MDGKNYLEFNPDPRQNPPSLWMRFVTAVQTLTLTRVEGDDLSHYQAGHIQSWPTKQTENKFSILKLGEGVSNEPDSLLFEFASSAKNAGTRVMVYWFFRSHV